MGRGARSGEQGGERSDDWKVVSYSGGWYVRGAIRRAEDSSLEERQYIVVVVASL